MQPFVQQTATGDMAGTSTPPSLTRSDSLAAVIADLNKTLSKSTVGKETIGKEILTPERMKVTLTSSDFPAASSFFQDQTAADPGSVFDQLGNNSQLTQPIDPNQVSSS